ncbi:MAG: DUF1206 domain-containing protein [Chloroflexi bacterium]|nr:DUF1206 domain-containing protein [Chloroflexota bacterium]
MSQPGASIGKVKDQAEQAANKAQGAADNPWVERLARFGYLVRGLLYALVGLLAVQVAAGVGGQTTDKNGAIAAIAAQPYGKFLLVLVVIGLIGYSLWGFVRAILDPLKRGTDPKGLAVRGGYIVSGLSYGALVIPAMSFILGNGGGGNGSNGSQDITARLLTAPFGVWLVGLVGVVGMIGGLGQMYQAYSADFKKDFKSAEMSADEMKWATRIGRFGLAARGVVFVMLGFFVLQAALQVDPKAAKGLDGALQTLARQPQGPWLLGIVALGLISFGVYSILCARWIRVKKS